MLSMIITLISMLGSDVEYAHRDHFEGTDLYGNHRPMTAALWCRDDGPPRVITTPTTTHKELVEELLHAVDCLDDGALNGSPMAGGSTTGCTTRLYYLRHPAERWAAWGMCHQAQGLILAQAALAPVRD